MDESNPSMNPAGRPRTVNLPEGPVHVVVDQPSRGFWGKAGRRLLWIALGISVLANIRMAGEYRSYFQPENDVQEKYHSLDKHSPNKVAIISVEGAIMGGDGFVKKQIDRVREDKDVKAVVLRVDSPGGTVTGSDYIYHHLKQLTADRKIPLVVSMGSVAASGGYYVAMAAGDAEQLIYAEPTTWTGSIGVIIPHYDLSGLLGKWDVSDDSISSHPLKQMGSPTAKLPEPFREQERAILKQLVDDSFAGFKQIVLASRRKLRNDRSLQDTVFTGRIFTAKQAKDNGLVDELGFIEDAIDRSIKLAGLSKDNVRVVEYKKQNSLSELLMARGSKPGMSFDLGQLVDLTAPRAYYLYTWLPSLMGTAQ